MSTRPIGPNTRSYNRLAPLVIHSPSGAIPEPLPLAKPSTISEALRANTSEMQTMLSTPSCAMYYSTTKEALRAQYLSNRETILAKLEESLYIYQGVPMTDHASAIS